MSTESVCIDDMKKEIDLLKKEIEKIKSNMIDPDALLTEEDYIALQNYRMEKEKGQLLSESEVKAGLGL